MLVNQETKVTTEIIGVSIFLSVEEAKILQYILRKHHEDYMCSNPKLKECSTYIAQANFLSEDLCKEIANKMFGV